MASPRPPKKVLFKCYKKTIPHSIKERGIQGKDYFNTIKGFFRIQQNYFV